MTAFDCDACGLAGGPFATEEEAWQHAGTHDDLHHRGQPTAEVRAVADEIGGAR